MALSVFAGMWAAYVGVAHQAILMAEHKHCPPNLLACWSKEWLCMFNGNNLCLRLMVHSVLALATERRSIATSS